MGPTLHPIMMLVRLNWLFASCVTSALKPDAGFRQLLERSVAMFGDDEELRDLVGRGTGNDEALSSG